MQITHLGHACVLVETEQAKLLIDPGNFSDGAWTDLTDLDAVLITHLHPDHLDPDQLPGLLAANPTTPVYVEPSILEQSRTGALPELPTGQALAAGQQTRLGGVEISAVGGQHAVIHRDLPRAGNVGYVLRVEGEPTLFHPGDAYDTAPAGVDILALPLHAPWAAMKETVDFARAVGAPAGFPIHDGLLNDRGRGMVIGRINDMSDTQLTDLRGAGPSSF